MILSASRRTDIPAFYPQWLMNRLREGYVLLQNPYSKRISRLSLSPETVDLIVFWTKDPHNLLPFLSEIESLGYAYCFQITVTPYGRDLEPGLRCKSAILSDVQALSARIGKARLLWRYDPIILNAGWTAARHTEAFAGLCRELAGCTDRCAISFVDAYKKLARLVQSRTICPVCETDMRALAAALSAAAASYGFRLSACCEPVDFTAEGVERSGCLDRAWIERIVGQTDLRRDPNQRGGCRCVESVDIGMYDSCGFGCVYCYANQNAARVQANLSLHNPDCGLLIGAPEQGEVVAERPCRSNHTGQPHLYF